MEYNQRCEKDGSTAVELTLHKPEINPRETHQNSTRSHLYLVLQFSVLTSFRAWWWRAASRGKKGARTCEYVFGGLIYLGAPSWRGEALTPAVEDPHRFDCEKNI